MARRPRKGKSPAPKKRAHRQAGKRIERRYTEEAGPIGKDRTPGHVRQRDWLRRHRAGEGEALEDEQSRQRRAVFQRRLEEIQDALKKGAEIAGEKRRGRIIEVYRGACLVELFREADAVQPPGAAAAPVPAASGGFLPARGKGRLVRATWRGLLQQFESGYRNVVATGDRVELLEAFVPTSPADVPGIITRVEPRRSIFARPAPDGRSAHVIATNVDQIIVVVSLHSPALRPGLIDRYLVYAHSEALPLVVIANKTDLAREEDLDPATWRRLGEFRARHPQRFPALGKAHAPTVGAATQDAPGGAGESPAGDQENAEAEDEVYPGEETGAQIFSTFRAIGVRVVFASATTGFGLEEVRSVLQGRLSVLTGHSGVGKSTLLNELEPGLNLEAAGLSASTGKGRHTTPRTTLLALACGADVIDTPGLREFGLWGVTRKNLAFYFPEMKARIAECGLRDCSHQEEPGCAVIAALAAGKISARRYQSYLRIRRSLRE